MLTPRDLENADRKSGYSYVSVSSYKQNPKPYYAEANRGRGRNVRAFRGPRRRTALAAAHDYCHWVNGTGVTHATLTPWQEPVIDMGSSTDHADVPSDPSVRIVRDAYTGPHDLYDVLLIAPNGEIICRKVGITRAATRRYADICRTFGISIKPVTTAKTYPDKAAALDAERERIAGIDQNSSWRRVAKEAFAPANRKATSP